MVNAINNMVDHDRLEVQVNPYSNMNIKHLTITKNIVDRLYVNDIHTLGELICFNKNQLTSLTGIGPMAATTILRATRRYNADFKVIPKIPKGIKSLDSSSENTMITRNVLAKIDVNPKLKSAIKDKTDQTIITLRLQGKTNKEIGVQLVKHPRTIQKRISLLLYTFECKTLEELIYKILTKK